MSVPTVSLPTANGWSPQEDRGIWAHNGLTVSVMGNANVTTRDGSTLPQKMAAAQVETLTTETHNDSYAETPIASSSAMAAQPVAYEMVMSLEAISQSEAALKSDDVPFTAKSETALTPHDHFDHAHWDDNLFAFLADEQVRLHRKKDKWFGEDDDADHWLAEFEKLALLELRK